mmetsp:Transcript_17380/g.41879  ORF Transcript_17380/g.41879 Transcript_17380/m.41879 type:complete len:138 (-) Transcript_17380:317-730(-)
MTPWCSINIQERGWIDRRTQRGRRLHMGSPNGIFLLLLISFLLGSSAHSDVFDAGGFDSVSRFDHVDPFTASVRQPAEGFFVGGSSIKDMNGVYRRVRWVHTDISPFASNKSTDTDTSAVLGPMHFGARQRAVLVAA